jgi:hypothetical protein
MITPCRRVGEFGRVGPTEEYATKSTTPAVGHNYVNGYVLMDENAPVEEYGHFEEYLPLGKSMP